MKFFEHEVVGWWGPASATIDWCEENYIVNHYVAEWYNTLSNLAFIIVGLYGIYNCQKENLERRISIFHMGIITIGIGSALFHGTLLYLPQLTDELPMIYASCVLIYITYEDQKDIKYGKSLPAALFLFSVAVTVIYCILRIPILFQSIYGMQTFVIMFKILLLMKEPRFSRFKILFLYSLFCYALAFFLWNLDNQSSICHWLRSTRVVLPLGSEIILQFHALWHLIMSMAVYYTITAMSCIRCVTLGYTETYYTWSCLMFPYVVPSNTAFSHKKK